MMSLVTILVSLMMITTSSSFMVNAFIPLSSSPTLSRHFHVEQQRSSSKLSMAKYNTINEILAKFPNDKPVLINFYDSKTENDIKDDIFRAKTLLADRCTIVSIKQQDYPDIAKLWDANVKSPSMILFEPISGQPLARLYEETHYLEIVAKFGQYCK